MCVGLSAKVVKVDHGTALVDAIEDAMRDTLDSAAALAYEARGPDASALQRMRQGQPQRLNLGRAGTVQEAHESMIGDLHHRAATLFCQALSCSIASRA